MRTNTVKPNATKVQDKSFQNILNEMMKLTSNGNIKVANKHWNIHKRGVSANDINYYPIQGA